MSELYQPDKMTGEQYYKLELDVAPEMPDFKGKESPIISVETPLGELILHHRNTKIVEHSESWTHMDYIKVEGHYPEPIYFFRDTFSYKEEAEKWHGLADKLLEYDFTYEATQAIPRPEIFIEYWRGVRGEKTLDEVLREILSETEQ